MHRDVREIGQISANVHM